MENKNDKIRRKLKATLTFLIVVLIILSSITVMNMDELGYTNSSEEEIYIEIIFAAFIVVIIISAIFSSKKVDHLKQVCKYQIKAIIIDYKIGHNKSGKIYYPIYQFIYDGKMYEVCSKSYEKYKNLVGKEVTLKINQYNPNEFLVMEEKVEINTISGINKPGKKVKSLAGILMLIFIAIPIMLRDIFLVNIEGSFLDVLLMISPVVIIFFYIVIFSSEKYNRLKKVCIYNVNAVIVEYKKISGKGKYCPMFQFIYDNETHEVFSLAYLTKSPKAIGTTVILKINPQDL